MCGGGGGEKEKVAARFLKKKKKKFDLLYPLLLNIYNFLDSVQSVIG